MVAFIVAAPVLGPYYVLERIYGRCKWVGISFSVAIWINGRL